MITLAIPMAAYLVTVYQNKWLKLIYTGAVPLIVYAVFLTGTRTAAIVAIIGVAYWLFTYRKSSLKLKVSILVLFMMSVVLVFSLAPKESVDRIFTSGKSISSGTLNSRTVIWGASLNQWKNAPIIGNGIGSLGSVLSTEHVQYDSAHNTYIHILTENGLVGLSLYLFLIISILYYTLQTPLNQKSFLIALLMVILVSQITQHTHFHKETWFALTMLAIHAYAFSSKRKYN
jgi:O-antigen ligase